MDLARHDTAVKALVAGALLVGVWMIFQLDLLVSVVGVVLVIAGLMGLMPVVWIFLTKRQRAT